MPMFVPSQCEGFIFSETGVLTSRHANKKRSYGYATFTLEKIYIFCGGLPLWWGTFTKRVSSEILSNVADVLWIWRV